MHYFLSNTGLYKTYTLLENYKIGNQNYTSPKDFIGKTFEYYCEKEETKRTFELELAPETKFNLRWQEKNKIPSENFINGKLNYTFQVIGKCSSCKEYHIIFLLNVFSDNLISDIIDNTRNISFKEESAFDFPTNIYIQKVV